MLIPLILTSLGTALLAADADDEKTRRNLAKWLLFGVPVYIAGSHDWGDAVFLVRARLPTIESAAKALRQDLRNRGDDPDDYRWRVYAMILGGKSLDRDLFKPPDVTWIHPTDVPAGVSMHFIFQAEQDIVVITLHPDTGLMDVETSSGRQVDLPGVATHSIDELSEFAEHARLKYTPSYEYDLEPTLVVFGGRVLYVAEYRTSLSDI